MNIKAEISESAYFEKLSSLYNNLDQKGLLLNTNLNHVRKSGFKWFLLKLCRPVFFLCGRDVYSHVRINSVGKKLFEYCELNQQYNSEATKRLEKVLFDKLGEKSKKYTSELETIQASIPHLHSLKWPNRAEQVGLTPRECLEIDRIIRARVKLERAGWGFTPSKNNGKTKWNFSKGNQEIAYVLPRKVYLYQGDWIIHTKKTIAGNKNIDRLKVIAGAYSLTNGRHLIKKNLSLSSLSILSDFKKRQIPCTAFLEHVIKTSSNEGKKYEYRCDTTLLKLVNQPQLKELSTKIALISDILTGLSNLHSIELKYKNSNGTDFIYPYSHRDLSLDNIFVNKDRLGQYHAVIGDYASPPDIRIHKLGCVPPEFFGSYPDMKNREINKAVGRSIDIWQIGLLMSSIMVGRLHEHKTPFKCISDKIREGYLLNLQWKDSNIQHLTQEALDVDLNNAREESLRLYPDNPGIMAIWELIGDCLKIDPAKRITAQEAFGRFEQIVKNMPSIS